MVNEAGPPPRVRRREIAEADLPALVPLLTRGFPLRAPSYWSRGLRRMGERAVPEGCPRFGYLLEAEGAPVGVLLTLFQAEAGGDETRLRCNLSSWFVDPACRMHAPLLTAAAMRRRDVTYFNISPAPHTWATIEAQGFVAYARGQSLMVPVLGRQRETARVAAWAGAAAGSLPEAELLGDHAALGCIALLVEASDGPHPFLFMAMRARSGRLPLPLAQLVYCRSIAEFHRFAVPLGRALARRGFAGVVFDGDAPRDGPPGLSGLSRGRKYYRGPHPPRLGDLSYTERVILGA